MAEYIERESLIKRLASAGTICDWGLYLIKDEPAADVIAVVRCRDCRFYYDKHYEDEGEPPYIKRCCKYSNHTRQPDDFCSLGERKSGEQE